MQKEREAGIISHAASRRSNFHFREQVGSQAIRLGWLGRGWVVFQQAEIQAAAEKKKQERGDLNHGLDTPAANRELCA